MNFKTKNNLILILFLSTIIFYRLLICINYTPEISVGETNNIWNALNVAHGKPLYSNPESTPFEIFQYTPLSQLPLILAAKVFDANSDKYAYNVMVIGRLCSLIFNILTFCFIYLLLKNSLNMSETLSLAAAVTGFALLTHLAFAVRPDAMALFLTILSLYLFSIAFFKHYFFYYSYSAIVFAVAFFAKQDAVSIISAAGLFLLINKKWKELILFVSCFLIFFGTLLFAFEQLFGEYFLSSIVGGLAQGYDITNAKDVLFRFFNMYGILLLFSLIVIVVSFTKILKENHFLFLLLLTVISLLIALVTSVKMGSWVNYYTPFVIYIICLLFYYLDYLIKKNGFKILELLSIILTVLFALFFIYRQFFHYTSPFLKYSHSKVVYYEINNNFKDFKKNVEENKYTVFVFDKRLKLMLFKNTIFPNTEYYHHTLFSFDGYNKLSESKQLEYYIVDTKLNNEQLSALNYFKVPVSSFVENDKKMSYLIYKYDK